MGGYGSTRWGGHWKKDTVEDCNVLSVRDLIDYARLAPSVRVIGGGIAWYDTVKDEKTASIGVDIDTRPTEGYARFHYTVTPLHGQGDKFDQDYKVPLVTTRPYFGGLRWWLLCPGRRCGRRVAKLYFPPGNGVKYFLCRHCYHLTYRSSQTHNKRLDWLKRLDTATLVELLDSDYAMEASTVILDRYL